MLPACMWPTCTASMHLSNAQADRHAQACRGDSEDSEDEEEDCPQEKRVPAWARGQELMQGLHAQLATDPDEIFQQRQRTCALDDVFSAPGEPTACFAACCMLPVYVGAAIASVGRPISKPLA